MRNPVKLLKIEPVRLKLHYLKEYTNDCPLWIAAYSGKHRVEGVDWAFHQFTEKVIVKDIKTSVDGNDFIGSLEDLNTYRIE